MDPVEERIATNEAIFRRVNEHIAAAPGRFDSADFVCECGEPDCHQQLRVSLDRYAEIRSDPLLFFVAPGHQVPKMEIVVERGEEFHVIRKPEEAKPVLERFE